MITLGKRITQMFLRQISNKNELKGNNDDYENYASSLSN